MLNNETKFNTRALASLAALIKTESLEEQTWTNRVALSLQVLNETLLNRSRIQSYIRQTELAIIQLRNYVQNLITSLEIAFTGKLPISLVNPGMLSEILKSIVMRLPTGNSL
jgi:hypothetical protein